MVSPLVKWAGGKRSFAGSAMAFLLPDDFKARVYVEPMVGGGAAFLAHGVLAPKAYLCDINAGLMATYLAVRDDPDDVLHWLRQLPVSKAGYLDVRSNYNAEVRLAREEGLESRTHLAAMMLYLNHFCFNGVYRENSKGDFNVPWGKRGDSSALKKQEPLIPEISKALQGVKLVCASMGKIRDWCPEDAFLFVDPPYVTKGEFEQGGGFTGYSAGGFSETDLRQLSWLMRYLVEKRGCKVMITHTDNAIARDVFSWMTPRPILASYSVSQDGAKRGDVAEVAFVSY